MDPQQRILLELVYEAFEKAGWPREKCRASHTAVYAAIFGTDYERNLYKDVLDLPMYQSVGTGIAILANRISHAFDLRGPSVTLDTGCSGGLVALHHACTSIRNGEVEAAVVAAANLQLMPDQYFGMSSQHMVSNTGRCYPFDSRGDGYGRGEGFVVVIIKSLETALRDHDPIYSVIVNTGINQDGHTSQGITYPSRAAQAELIRQTYTRAGLTPKDIAYIEAHGTGTVAGDSEELAALADVFVPGRALPLYVGSNKGSVGHTESTSGLISLLKASLMLDREVIPPVGGFAIPKPGLPLKNIQIPTQLLPWPHTEGTIPRISINSFGYGGTNAHVILERGPRTGGVSACPGSANASSTCSYPFVVSANSKASLQSLLKAYVEWAERHPETPLADLSYTLCHGRSVLPWRVSWTADRHSALVEELQQRIHNLPSKPVPSKSNVIFVFTGQGAQWAGMGRDLLLAGPSSVFHDSILASRDILYEIGAPWDLVVELLRQDGESDINNAKLAQPATTAIQIALVALLRAQGVRPWAVVGHSSGEIAAAYAAGRLSHRRALHIAYHRGFMADASKGRGLPCGAMLSISLGEEGVAPFLKNLTKGQAGIACVNSPSSVTVSGDADAIDEVKGRIATYGNGIHTRKLFVDTAYHSYHMRAVADEYRARLRDLHLIKGPRIEGHQESDRGEVTLVSSVTGLLWSSDLTDAYWVENLVSPVRFSDAVQTITQMHHRLNHGHAILIELGPHSALAGPVRQCLAAPNVPKFEHEYVSALQRGMGAIPSALKMAGRLFELGVQLNFNEISALIRGSKAPVMLPNLPSYTWDHTVKHWHESRLDREYRIRREPYHHLLGVRVTDSTPMEPRWRHMVGLSTLPWLADHVIDNLVIFPGAGYVCMVAEALMQLVREREVDQVLELLDFHDISFLRALVVPASPQRVELQLSLKRQEHASPLCFAFSVSALSDGKWNEFCNGFVNGVMATNGLKPEAEVGAPICRQDEANWTSLDPEDIYTEMATNGNAYGPTFRSIRSLKIAADAITSTAVVEVPDVATIMPAQYQAPHVMHPATFDSLFHVGIPMITRNHGNGSLMPVHIDGMLLSVNSEALSRPGSALDVSAQLTSRTFRAIRADITVMSDGHPVLNVSGLESRNFGIQTSGNHEGICYELTWQPDLDFLRASDLPATPTLSDLVGYICFKIAKVSVIELGAGRGDLAAVFLAAVSAHGGTMTTYDFVDNTPELFDHAQKHLVGHPVCYRTLDYESPLEFQGFRPHSYDVILSSKFGSPIHVPALLKKNGVLILVLSLHMEENWQNSFRDLYPGLEVQLTFQDPVSSSLVVMARAAGAQPLHLPPYVKLLTHSAREVTPPWVIGIQRGLREFGAGVSLETLSQSIEFNDNVESCVVVIDDLQQPILSDQGCFEAAITLLQRTDQVLWLSLDDPPAMHQVTGVARTAHAENAKLRLTTAHIASEVFKSERVFSLIIQWLGYVTDKSVEPHHEREYRVSKEATVHIPRLHRSDRLNHAVSTQRHVDCRDLRMSRFVDPARPLVLSFDETSLDSSVIFVDDRVSELASDAIEIQTRAFVLSKTDSLTTPALGEYAGVVTRVGKAIENFVAGDEVVALCVNGVIGHNRPRVPYFHASKRPDGLTPSTAAALLLPCLAATYSLQCLANLPKAKGAILVHGALSDIGRATVAVARSLGVIVAVTATDNQEALESSKQLDIDVRSIIIGRPSLSSRRYQKFFQLDAIVHATEEPIPVTAWACLKPSGHVILHSSSPSVPLPKLPRNATIHFCDITEVLRTQPSCMINLLPRAAAALQQIPIRGLDLRTHDVASVAEAFRQLNLGTSSRIVIQAGAASLDRTLETMTFDDFVPVTLAKTQGTLNLEKVFTSPELKFFLMLSSAVNITGASGQANYNAGNAVQDAMAHSRPFGFMSLNIGWIEDAIHTSNDKTKLQGLWRTGLRPILSHELSKYFDYVLEAASSQLHLRQAVIGFDEASLSHTSARNSNVHSALFCHLEHSFSPSDSLTSIPSVCSFREVVESGDYPTIVDFITKSIIGQMATLISIDPEQVHETYGSIISLGLDSLVAIELRNWITREFDAPLQSSEIMIDQPIRDLSQKVASRSRIVMSSLDAESINTTEGSSEEITDRLPENPVTSSTPASLSTKDSLLDLPPLPLPPLEDILQSFEHSRSAIDTLDDCLVTSQAVREFLEGSGPLLYQKIQEADPNDIADAYDRQVYLERREPLPEIGSFTFSHPVDAPAHTQALRASILTKSAIEFSRQLEKGEIGPGKLHGKTLTTEGSRWLFYATRCPGLSIDHMRRYTISHTVIVLRRGHVFKLTLPGTNQPLHLPAIHAAYDGILRASNEPRPSLAALTADKRDSWATLRQELERDPVSSTTLDCIDAAAFVLCLDDESPASPGERYTQFLLGGADRPFVNRWLDKSLQFVVTANGLSAGVYDHTKLDGLDARMLHAHICRVIQSEQPSNPANASAFSLSSTSDSTIAYPVHECIWNPSPAIIRHAEQVSVHCRAYGPLDYRILNIDSLGLSTLRLFRLAPNATALLTVHLALYLADGYIRPAWDRVSLGAFARGRVDWVQTMSPATRAFVETAATAAISGNDDARARACALLKTATATSSRALAAASRGYGFVGHLYALRGVAQQQQQQLPALFETQAWAATSSGGPGGRIKLGFMRFLSDSDIGSHADTEGDQHGEIDYIGEAGFLSPGENGIYIHCNVKDEHAQFALSGKPEYTARVYEAIRTSAGIVAGLLKD
ncbi:Type I Iterative PKS [Diatrype stigma]|uniref:Type I Iterative PKS n=1 Tax=Diatrype stigma TaxID=117547 RepID=A0AAN9UUJ1_9PEZI